MFKVIIIGDTGI